MNAGVGPAPASERVRHARRLFAGIAPGYERMGRVLSFGRDGAWRRLLVSRIPPGSRVLDVATGTGLVARALAARGCSVVGVDQSPEMLAGGGGARVQAAAERLPVEGGAFDALTFTYLLRYVDDPEATIRELAGAIRPGGVMASLEFGMPPHPILRLGWRLHARAVLPGLGALGGRAWIEAARFLGPSIEEYRRRWPPGREAAAWRAAGFGRVRWRELTFGAGVVTWGVRDG